MNWAVDLSRFFVPREGEASLYGVVLYTDLHANIKKVLGDPDYWDAFHEASGPRWAVFSIRAKPRRMVVPDSPDGSIGYMVPVWKEPRENRALLEAFELDSTEALPALVVFTQCADGRVLRSVQRLEDTSVDAAYQSLRTALAVVSKALEGVREENLRDPEGVHTAVDVAIREQKEWQTTKKGVSVLRALRPFIP